MHPTPDDTNTAASAPIRWRVSDLHPHALSLDHAPLLAGEISAADLIENIRALKPPPVILHLCCRAPADMPPETLVDAGFVQVGITRLFRIPLPTMLSDQTDSLMHRWHKPGEDADWHTWYEEHWNSYRRTHPINIAKDPGAARYPELFSGAGLHETLFAYDTKGLIGFSSLWADQKIGWVDTTESNPAALSEILFSTLRRATASGWSHAMLQVEDDHLGLWQATEAFSDVPQQDYITWQRSVC